MKKLFVSLVLGIMVLVGSYSATEAAELVNGYEVTIAEDGCRIYTAESMKRFAADHKGQNVTDEIFIATMQHLRHAAFK